MDKEYQWYTILSIKVLICLALAYPLELIWNYSIVALFSFANPVENFWIFFWLLMLRIKYNKTIVIQQQILKILQTQTKKQEI